MRMMTWRPNKRHLAALAGLVLAGVAGPVHALTPPSSPSGPVSSPEVPRPPRFQEVIAPMSPAGRAIMEDAVRKSAAEQQILDALKQTREDILRLIAAPNLDAEALEAAFMRERKLSFKLQAGRHDALLKAAGRLSPEDRQIFAEGLRATRLHIPGETVKQIQKAKERCAEEPGAQKRAR
ncbi:periplasmic heavy metal sensor [Pedomonas sp. V897]|uniref:periplasmic heavy metal sensor n=1 Tax=Pedomonas sp. V897 TaxID=3446482 RepID=UPI003EE32B82